MKHKGVDKGRHREIRLEGTAREHRKKRYKGGYRLRRVEERAREALGARKKKKKDRGGVKKKKSILRKKCVLFSDSKICLKG